MPSLYSGTLLPGTRAFFHLDLWPGQFGWYKSYYTSCDSTLMSARAKGFGAIRSAGSASRKRRRSFRAHTTSTSASMFRSSSARAGGSVSDGILLLLAKGDVTTDVILIINFR